MMLGVGDETRATARTGGPVYARDPTVLPDPRSDLSRNPFPPVSMRPVQVQSNDPIAVTYPYPVQPSTIAVVQGYTPAPVTWTDLDNAAAQLVSVLPADLSAVSTDMLQQLCGACANPAQALANKLGSTALASGVTIDGIVARYQGQITYACSRFSAELTKRGVTYACGGNAAGSTADGPNTGLLLLIAAGVAAAFYFGGRD